MTIVLSGAVVADSDAQNVSSPRSVVASLDLETAEVGRVTAHFKPEDRDRALELAALVDAASTMFETKLALSFPTDLAALGPDDWFADIPGIPYAMPWPSMNERLLILPSSLQVGLLVEGRSPEAGKRLVDFVALHEYGHIAAKEYFRPGDTIDYIPVQWFRELVATYFAYSYIATADGARADILQEEWAAAVAGSGPPVLSLDWGFMNSLSGRELAETYEWYQLMLNLRAAELFEKHGTAFLTALRRLPWDHAHSWNTDTVLEMLENVDAEFTNWARDFGTKR